MNLVSLVQPVFARVLYGNDTLVFRDLANAGDPHGGFAAACRTAEQDVVSGLDDVRQKLFDIASVVERQRDRVIPVPPPPLPLVPALGFVASGDFLDAVDLVARL